MGRELAEQRVTNSVPKNTAYTYNLDGSLKTLIYPSGRTITYTYNASGEPIEAQDVANGITYAANGTYTAPGGLATLATGGEYNTTVIYNPRLQPCWMYMTTQPASLAASSACTATATTGTILDLKYNFNSGADNGNVVGITNNRDTTRSQTFSYDQVNRIVTAGTPAPCGGNCWSQSFVYDQWANLTSATATGTAPPLTLAVNANNQVSTAGFTFDGAGNETHDVTSAYVWNAESEIKTGGGINYTYDGDGDRVEKSNGKIYWYGASSEILDESDGLGNFTNEYVFFGGKRIAMRTSRPASFITTRRTCWAVPALLQLPVARCATTPISFPLAASTTTPAVARRTTSSRARNATRRPTTTTSTRGIIPRRMGGFSRRTGRQCRRRYRMRT